MEEKLENPKPALGQFRRKDFETVLRQEKQLAELGREVIRAVSADMNISLGAKDKEKMA